MSLLEYVERGETDNVRELLGSRSFANVDQTNADGETVLMIAAQKGFAEIVKLLLVHGANPTLTTPVRRAEIGHTFNFAQICISSRERGY